MEEESIFEQDEKCVAQFISKSSDFFNKEINVSPKLNKVIITLVLIGCMLAIIFT